MPTARTSHGRTPSRAYLGGSAVSPASTVLVSAVLVSTVPVTRSADHNLARGGCSTVFHDCGPAECPNAAVSDRFRSRYLPASVSTPHPNGSSATEASSATTIAPSRTVGPTTV